MNRLNVVRLLLGLASLSGACSALAQEWEPNSLDHTYLPNDAVQALSPSGRFEFDIVPDKKDAPGSAVYSLVKDGKRLWSERLPFTLSNAVVDDKGRSAGYTMPATNFQLILKSGFFDSSGKQLGWSWNSQPDKRIRFKVVFFSPLGRITKTNEYPLDSGGQSPAPPLGRDILLDSKNDRLLVRIDKGQEVGSEWWTYRWSTGQPVQTAETDAAIRKRFLTDKKSVRYGWFPHWRLLPDTPFVLLNNNEVEPRSKEASQYFYIANLRDSSIWKLIDQAPVDRWPDDVVGTDCVLSVGRNGRFDIRLAKENLRVSYQAKRGRTGWVVTKLGSKPYSSPKNDTLAGITVPAKRLRQVQRWSFPYHRQPSKTFEHVRQFCFVGQNVMLLVDGRDGFSKELTCAKRDGNVVWRVRLPDTGRRDYAYYHLKNFTANSCLLYEKKVNYREAAVWKVDVATGEIRNLVWFNDFPLVSAAGFPDGSYAVYGLQYTDDRVVTELRRYDGSGKVRWSVDPFARQRDRTGNDEDAAAIASFDGDGLAMLLKDGIWIFNSKGVFTRKLPLSVELGHSELGLQDLGHGRILAFGFMKASLVSANGDPPRNLQMTRRGKPLSYGTTDVKPDDSGRLWTCDTDSIYVLGSGGSIGDPIGTAPFKNGPSSVGKLLIDPSGDVTILDRYSGELYRYSGDGKRRFQTAPGADDFRQSPILFGELNTSAAGDTYEWTTNYLRKGIDCSEFIHYSPDGKRIGYQDVETKAQAPVPTPLPPSWRWFQGRLIDESGKFRQMVLRWPDGSWIDRSRFYDAPDGSWMVTDLHKAYPLDRTELTKFGFFSASGEPQGEFRLPTGLVSCEKAAFDGRFVFLADAGQIVAFNRSGKALWRFKPGMPIGEIYPSRGGLAVWDGNATIAWFALPSNISSNSL